jgi:8-oxo-dGTP pyrophosphatase MutT (NUDIX family)
VREETGLTARVVTGLGSVSYYYTFHHDGRADKRHKIVHFFLMEATGGDITRFDREEIADCRWFPVERALEVLNFDDEKDLVRRAAAKFTPEERRK